MNLEFEAHPVFQRGMGWIYTLSLWWVCYVYCVQGDALNLDLWFLAATEESHRNLNNSKGRDKNSSRLMDFLAEQCSEWEL